MNSKLLSRNFNQVRAVSQKQLGTLPLVASKNEKKIGIIKNKKMEEESLQ